MPSQLALAGACCSAPPLPAAPRACSLGTSPTTTSSVRAAPARQTSMDALVPGLVLPTRRGRSDERSMTRPS